MGQVKRRTFSGCVCEQEVYLVSERVKDIASAEPKRPRFKTEKEREDHYTGISRRKHNRNFNENFGPRSRYATLTCDDENEIHDFKSAKRIRDNYLKVLKYHCPEAVIFIYIGRGKSTHRIHFHMVSDGVPEELIKEKWKYGSVIRISHLREHNYYNGVDHGQDYTGLANYLFDHWTKEQGGHRWKQTKNARKPDREPAKEVKPIHKSIKKERYTLERPPQPPKGYMLVESRGTPYGYLYFRYVKIPPAPEKRKTKRMRGPLT